MAFVYAIVLIIGITLQIVGTTFTSHSSWLGVILSGWGKLLCRALGFIMAFVGLCLFLNEILFN